MNKLLQITSKMFGCKSLLPQGEALNFYFGLTLFVFESIYILIVFYKHLSKETTQIIPVVHWFLMSSTILITILKTYMFSNKYWKLMNAFDTMVENLQNGGMNALKQNTNKLLTKKKSVMNVTDLINNYFNYFVFLLWHLAYLVLIYCYIYWQFQAQLVQEYVYITMLMFCWELLNVFQESVKQLNKNMTKWCKVSSQKQNGGNNNRTSETRNSIATISLDEPQNVNFDYTLDYYLLQVETHNDLVLNFNSHFGWTLLFSVSLGVSYILGYCAYLVKTNSTNMNNLWTPSLIYFVGTGIFLPVKCEHVVRERARTKLLLRKLWNRYKEQDGGKYLQKLGLLMQQTSVSSNFSAQGFFHLNYAMLFTFINIVITYLVVIIQFK